MSDSTPTHVKTRPSPPAGFFAAEAAGLAWLKEAEAVGGAAVVTVVAVSPSALTLERLAPVMPTDEAAHAFGAALARTHRAGAPAFGALPPGADRYFFGPLDAPIPLGSVTFDEFGAFYAQARLRPLAERVSLPARKAALLTDVCDRLAEGHPRFADVTPSRVHGDLWSGNLMWTKRGAVLIDPAACGNHHLADLAMLDMFGLPHLDAVHAGFEEVQPLPADWRDELPLHQLFGQLAHLALFGPSYEESSVRCLEGAATLLGL